MSERTQDYASHRRWSWPYHFVAVPILTIDVVVRLVLALRFAPDEELPELVRRIRI